MIEERIDELRAIALGSMHVPVERAGDDPASSPAASHAARMPGMTPGVARMQDSTTGHPRASLGPIVVPHLSPSMRDRDDDSLAQLVGASVSRIETAVHDDFTRLEEMLRVWGAPSDKMMSGLQRMERSIRAEFARVLETVHSLATSPSVVAAAIEASANQLEERNELRFTHLEARIGATSNELEHLTEAVREYGESVATAAGSAGAIAGSNIADEFGRQVSEWAEGVAGHVADLHNVIDQLQREIGQNSASAELSAKQVSEALADGMTTVAEAVSSGLEAVGASMLELESKIVGDLAPLAGDEMSATLVEGTREAVAAALAAHEEATMQRFDELSSRITTLRDGLAELSTDEVVARIEAVRADLADAGIGLVVQRLDDVRADVLERGVGELIGRIDGMQSSIFDDGFAQVLDRIDTVRSHVIKDGFDSLGRRLTSAQGEAFEKSFARLSRRFDVVHSSAVKQGIQDLAQHVQSAHMAAANELQTNLATELAPIRSLLRRFVGSGADTGAVEELGVQLAEIIETLDSGLSRQITLLGSGIAEQLGSVDTRLSERLQVLNVDGTVRKHVEDFAQRVDQMHAAGLEELQATIAPKLESISSLVKRVDDTAVDPAMVEELGERVTSLIDLLESGIGSQIFELGSGIAEQLTRLDTRVSEQLQELEAAGEAGFASIQRTLGHIQDAAVGPTMLDDLGSKVIARIESLDADMGSRVMGRIESLDTRLGRHITSLNSGLTHQLDTLDARITEQINALETRTNRLLAAPAGIGGSGVDTAQVGDMLRKAIAEQSRDVQSWIGKIEDAAQLVQQAAPDQLIARIEELEETLLVAQDEVPDELVERIEQTVSPLLERFSDLDARLSRLGEIEDRITQLAEQPQRAPEPHRPTEPDVPTDQLVADMSEQIIEAVADSRVRQAEDIEIVLDGMLAVWQQVAERMQSTDQRIERLASMVEQLVANNAGLPKQLAASTTDTHDAEPSGKQATQPAIAPAPRKSGKRSA